MVGNYKLAFIFSTKQLKNFLEIDQDREQVKFVSTPTSKGFLLNLEQANKFCINKVYFLR